MEQNLKGILHYENLKTIKYTHLATTVEYANAIGEELGYTEDQLKVMEVGATLHDIGKSFIPPEILNKKGRLSDDEREIVNLHAVIGYEILKSLGYGVNVAEIARDHHNPLSKNPMAQIVRAADIYSAMREERSYKKAKTHEEAMEVLKSARVPQTILNALDKRYGKRTTERTITNPIQGFSTRAAIA